MTNEEIIIELLTEIRDSLKKPEKKPINRFVPPTRDDIGKYCLEKNYCVDPDKFIDFYTSKNWYVGKNKMKDWKAAVRTWGNRNNGSHQQNSKQSLAERATAAREEWERNNG